MPLKASKSPYFLTSPSTSRIAGMGTTPFFIDRHALGHFHGEVESLADHLPALVAHAHHNRGWRHPSGPVFGCGPVLDCRQVSGGILACHLQAQNGFGGLSCHVDAVEEDAPSGVVLIRHGHGHKERLIADDPDLNRVGFAHGQLRWQPGEQLEGDDRLCYGWRGGAGQNDSQRYDANLSQSGFHFWPPSEWFSPRALLWLFRQAPRTSPPEPPATHQLSSALPKSCRFSNHGLSSR